MHLHKLTVFVSAILLFIGTGFAQEAAKGPYLKDGVSIYSKVYSYANKIGREIIDRECGDGCFFVKFKVDAKGNVTDLQSNNGAWHVLDTLVKSALISTSGQWETAKKKNYANKTFLLPVLFKTGYCQTGLKTNTAAEILASIPTIKDTADLDTIVEKSMIYNFLHMTDFDNKPASSKPLSMDTYLECILLAPIHLTARSI